ncbi:hypothetical protein GCK32_006312 [Trichostrongylus colubriformis]|uniref:Receptor L-domain domain-containing protein n=1 Tax=Trichostrongylus colubriformis TaxID=6319 RepID=A0AAN8G2B0_TRICO
MCLGMTMIEKADEFCILRRVTFFVFIAMMLTSSAVGGKKKKVYPVNESFTVNEETSECLFRGKNSHYYGVRSHCYYAYGNMTGEEFPYPLFYQMLNWTGCMIFARLHKLEYIPLSSVESLRANTDFCKLKYGLLVYGNEKLYRINLRKTMDIRKEEVFIRANPNLTRDQVIDAPFEVDVGDPHDCTMEMALKRKDCTGLVGDVRYPGDANMRNVWIGVSRVYGTITVNGIRENNLDMLKKLTVDGWLPRVVRIVNNHQLRHIDELLKMKVTGPEPLFWFHNNTSFCHTIDIRSKIEAKVKTKLSWDERCLKRCAGGVIDAQYLKKFHRFCNIVDGDLIIEGLKGSIKHYSEICSPCRLKVLLQRIREISFTRFLLL